MEEESACQGWESSLIAISVSNLTVYYLLLFKMPKSVFTAIKKLFRDFLWYGEHLIKWETVCKIKEKGGLGIGNLEARNVSLFGKWLRRFPMNLIPFGAKVKSLNMVSLTRVGILQPKLSLLLKVHGEVLSHPFLIFYKEFKSKVGNGDKNLFWKKKQKNTGPVLLKACSQTQSEYPSPKIPPLRTCLALMILRIIQFLGILASLGTQL